MFFRIQLIFILFISAISAANASQVEVMHWWTSTGELQALNALRNNVEFSQNTWKDAAIKGGGGNTALTVLRSRAVSGNPPAAALIKGHNIQEWASLGFLTSLNQVAETEKWDEKIPTFMQDIMKYQGHYVAAPINIHRINWLWTNNKIFAQENITPPTDLDALIAVMEKLQRKGILPFAHTSEPWADAILFESIALSILGPDDYQKAFVDLDLRMLTSPEMQLAFEKLRTISMFIDDDAKGRSWDQATAMVANGDAAMQIMGDWVLSELDPKQTFIQCMAFPGTAGSFSYNIDSFAFFKLKSVSEQTKAAQFSFAKAILDPKLQQDFNLKKGSLPAINNADMSEFSPCLQQSQRDYQAALKNNTLVPTFSQAMATTTYVQSAITNVINNYIYDKSISNVQATILLANAVTVAQ